MTCPAPKPETIDNITRAAYPAFAMLAGMQLDVFTPLSNGPKTIEEVAEGLRDHVELSLEVLGSFLRRGEIVENPVLDSCHTSFLLAVVGRENAVRAAELLIKALPLSERADDLCVLGGLLWLGPSSYPALFACAEQRRVGQSYWCLTALVAQVTELDDVNREIGIMGSDGEVSDPPLKRSEIRKMARRWKNWWEANKDSVDWDRKTRQLRFVTP